MENQKETTETKESVNPEPANFVHLHCHSEFSSLDGGSRIKDMPEALKKRGFNAMALTDHGVMQGLSEFYDTLVKEDIKPILGLEAYLTDDRFTGRETVTWHITLLAENNTGYYNLCKLSSWAFIDGAIQTYDRARARADWELMEKYSEGIICLTGCMAGPIMGEIMKTGDIDLARQRTERLIEIYGKENVYGEIQNAGVVTGIPGDSQAAQILGKKPLTEEEALDYNLKNAGWRIKKLQESWEKDELEAIVNKDLKLFMRRIFKENDEVKEDPNRFFKDEENDFKPDSVVAYAWDMPKNDKIEAGEITISQEEGNQILVEEICKPLGLKYVGTGDVHYLNEEDAEPHDVMICIGTGQRKKQPPRKFSLLPKTYHLRTRKEMEEVLSHYPESLDETVHLAERCSAEITYGHELLPRFNIPDDFKDSKTYLEHLCEEGRQKLYPEGSEFEQESKQRLEMELAVINNMGFNDYFLIVWDLFREARKRNMPYGPGRGSAAGAIVAYTLGITQVCPLQFGLLFERFLNPDRKSMPDIDMDFGVGVGPNGLKHRDELIEYAKEKYNREAGCETAVAQIVTFGKFKAKGALRDSARVLAEPGPENLQKAYRMGDKLAGMIPNDPRATMRSVWTDEEEGKQIRAMHASDEFAREIINQAGWLEGLIRNNGTHAAAVIIAGHDLSDDLPLQQIKKDKPIEVQYDMVISERIGLLKMDFLGLRNLDIIWDCIERIKHVHGVDIGNPYHDIPIDDPKTFELLANGETEGIFQFESDGMKGALKMIQPTTFTDLAAIVSLYRPGPMRHIPTYADIKHGRQQVSYPHEDVESILSETYGITCIEENQMVLMADGSYKPIKDVRLGNKVVSFDIENQKSVIEECHGAAPTRYEKGLEITLNDGSSMILTKDHKVLTANGYVEAQNLKLDSDLIATPNFIETADYKALDQNWLAEDDNLAYVLGQLTGDGSLTGNTISLATGRKENHDKIVRFIQKNTNLKVNEYFHCRSWYCSLSNPDLLNDKNHGNRKTKFHKMLEDFDMKKSCYRKRIPQQVTQANLSVKKSYLAGLFDADGHITKNGYLVLTSVSENLLKDVKLLLLSLGITSRLNGSRLYISNSSKAYNQFGNKTMIIKWGKLSSGLQDRTRLTDRKNFKNKVIDAGISKKEIVDVYKISLCTLSSKRNFLLESIENKIFPATDISYRKIVSIQETAEEKQFYGMSVSNTHNLVCNFAIIKNCYQEQSMLIARKLAGFTPGEADDLRKAIGKKLKDKMAELKDPYLKGCIEHGLSKQGAEELWADNEAAADYSFNKCLHSETRVILPDGKRLRISEAYNQGITEIMSMWSDGEIRPHKIKNIVQTGRKPLYQIKTKSGRQVKATLEHRFLTNQGYLEVENMKVGETELIAMPIISDKQREARRKTMTKLSQSPERKKLDKQARERMIAYQASRPLEEKIKHMKNMHKKYPDLTKNGVKAMHKKIALLRKTDPEWVKMHAENSLASVRATYDTGPGYGTCSVASNGMWCASTPEREMCEYLIDLDVDFEMHKVLPNGKICDFYFDGLYWEMDGMDRVDAYFENKYSEIGLPYVVVTPEDFKQIICKQLNLEHAENGDPVVSIEYWGEGPTYDIEMQENGPKNFMANGIASHNSHAVCYALIAYITAYLKANYRECYMADLKSSVINQKDKLRSYLSDAKSAGVSVVSPDINRSLKNFAVMENEEGTALDILFGLNAISGVGEKVVEQILQEREARGPFKTMYDFIRRTPIGAKVVQALAEAGAFDALPGSRKGQSEIAAEAVEANKARIRREEKTEVDLLKNYLKENPGPDHEQTARGLRKFNAFETAVFKAIATARYRKDETPMEKVAIEAAEKKGLADIRREVRKELEENPQDVAGIANEDSSEDPVDTISNEKFDLARQEFIDEAKKLVKEAEEAYKHVDAKRSEQMGLLDIEDQIEEPISTEEWDGPELLKVERERLGIYVSGHPLDQHRREWAYYVDKGLGDIDHKLLGDNLRVAGALVEKEDIKTRKGDLMYKVTLEDLTGSQKITIFPDTASSGIAPMLEVGNILVFEVGVTEDTFAQNRSSSSEDEEESAEDDVTPVQLICSRIYNWDPSKIVLPDNVNVGGERLTLKLEEADADTIAALKELANECPGDLNLYVMIGNSTKPQKTSLRFDRTRQVFDTLKRFGEVRSMTADEIEAERAVHENNDN
jgi:DNA-directed DNA polymerase III PolC